MQVSHNELGAVLKQAFEGCGFDAGRYENAAQMVLWLQTHGLEGLTLLAASLDQFKNWSELPFELAEDSKHALVFDMKEQSILSSGSLVSSLVLAKALDNEYCVGTIRNVQEHAFIAKQLIDAQSMGLHGVAFWEVRTEALKSGGFWQMYRTAAKPIDNKPISNESANNACSLCPCLEMFNFSQLATTGSSHQESNHQISPEPSKDRYQLVLAYAKERVQLDQILSQQSALANVELLANTKVADSKAKYLHALTNGIEISTELWNRLLELGNNVLVESSEQSRKGAGA